MAEVTTKGRPLDDELTSRVLQAVRADLDEFGFMNLTIEGIAATVGCGKTAIYRRWPTKPELVAAAILDTFELGEVPDTGDVIDDLVAHAWQNIENFRRSHGGRTSGNGLLLAMFDMDVIPLIAEGFMQQRHAMGHKILDRAVARRQISADLDHDLILDSLAGLTLFKMTLKPDKPVPSDSALADTYRTLARSLVGRSP